jgi:hypothetical protein
MRVEENMPKTHSSTPRILSALAGCFVASHLAMADVGDSNGFTCSPDQTDPSFRAEFTGSLDEWDRQHGHFKDVEMVVYQALSEQQLTELATQGDLLASRVLDHKLRRQENVTRDERGRKIRSNLENAAVYGSTEALLRLSAFVNSGVEAGRLENTSPNLALALLDVALRRGDYNALSALELYVKQHASISSSDVEEAIQLSDEYYDRLEASRRERYLPVFKNNPPAMGKLFVPIFFKKVESQPVRDLVLRHAFFRGCT